MINTLLMKLAWKPTEQRGEKHSSGRLFSCFLVLILSSLMTELQPQEKKNERKHTVTVARKTVNHVSH